MSERGSIFEGNKRHVFEKWLGVVRHAFEKLMQTKERQTKMLLFGVNVWQKRSVYDRITALVNRTRNIVASDTQYKQGYKKEHFFQMNWCVRLNKEDFCDIIVAACNSFIRLRAWNSKNPLMSENQPKITVHHQSKLKRCENLNNRFAPKEF